MLWNWALAPTRPPGQAQPSQCRSKGGCRLHHGLRGHCKCRSSAACPGVGHWRQRDRRAKRNLCRNKRGRRLHQGLWGGRSRCCGNGACPGTGCRRCRHQCWGPRGQPQLADRCAPSSLLLRRHDLPEHGSHSRRGHSHTRRGGRRGGPSLKASCARCHRCDRLGSHGARARSGHWCEGRCEGWPGGLCRLHRDGRRRGGLRRHGAHSGHDHRRCSGWPGHSPDRSGWHGAGGLGLLARSQSRRRGCRGPRQCVRLGQGIKFMLDCQRGVQRRTNSSYRTVEQTRTNFCNTQWLLQNRLCRQCQRRRCLGQFGLRCCRRGSHVRTGCGLGLGFGLFLGSSHGCGL